MGSLTEREKDILRLLSNGNSVAQIAEKLDVSLASVSRSISRIRLKCLELEDDIATLNEVGFLKIENNKIKFISRDPKSLIKVAKKGDI